MCLAIVGGVVSAIGSIVQGIAAKQVANYNAKVAKLNAKAAEGEGIYRGGLKRKEGESVYAAQRAAGAKAGVDLDSGSFLEMQLEQSFRTERAAAIEIWQGRSEANKYRNQAKVFKAEGRAAMTGAVFNAASSLISGFMGAPPGQQSGPGAGGLGSASYGSVPRVGNSAYTGRAFPSGV